MIDIELAGPWYNFSEMEKKTGLVKNELLYFIDTCKIKPVVYTHNRPFIAVKILSNKLVGVGRFRYSGPLAVAPFVTQQMVREDITIIGNSIVQPLNTSNIERWTCNYPFFTPLPKTILDAWEPEARFTGDVYAILEPEECPFDHAETTLANLIPDHMDEDTFFDLYEERFVHKTGMLDITYATHAHSVFSQEDFRFPVSALAALEKACASNQDACFDQEESEPKRTNDLHGLLEHIVKTNPSKTSKAIWNMLRKDVQLDEPQYDVDGLIDNMDHLAIEWTNASGVTKQIKWNSFKVLISKIRKKVS